MLTIFFGMRDKIYEDCAYVPSFDNTLAIYEYNACHIVGMYNHIHIYDKVILSKKFKSRIVWVRTATTSWN